MFNSCHLCQFDPGSFVIHVTIQWLFGRHSQNTWLCITPEIWGQLWEVIVHFLLQLRTIVTLCKAVQHVSTFAESWIMQNSHISQHFILTFAAPYLNRREFVQNLRLRSLYQHALWPPNAGQNTQDYKFSFRNQLSIKFIFEVSWRTQWKLNKHDKNPMKTWSMISSHVTCSYMHLQLIINKMS